MIMTTVLSEVSINPDNEENFYQNIAAIILSIRATFDVAAVALDKGGENRDSHSTIR